jgi:hypothetical protein
MIAKDKRMARQLRISAAINRRFRRENQARLQARPHRRDYGLWRRRAFRHRLIERRSPMSRICSSLTTAAVVLCTVLAAAAAPAHAMGGIIHNSLMTNALTHNSLTHNSLTHNSLIGNALAPTGSQLGELNGVVVETVTLPDGLAR